MLYGFFVGVTFWDIPSDLDDRQTQLQAACMWIIMLQSYVHVFKVCFEEMNAAICCHSLSIAEIQKYEARDAVQR